MFRNFEAYLHQVVNFVFAIERILRFSVFWGFLSVHQEKTAYLQLAFYTLKGLRENSSE